MPRDTDSTVKFKADITDFKASMQEAGRYIRMANSEFKAATAGMNDWSHSADGLTAKVRQLNSILNAQMRQLDALTADYERVAVEQGADSKAAEELMIKINNQKAAIAQTQVQLNKYEDDLNEVTSGTKNAGKAAEEAANGGFTILKGAMANLVAQGISAAISGLRQLGSTLIDVGKQAVASYADYEQLVGGVETLFGAGGMNIEEYADSVGKTVDEVQGEYDRLMSAQDTVLRNASNAYRDVGMSANEYMDTVTSFSAALISSTGGDTERAAEAANAALIDMADNANKMGTNMASIQNAYQGFAKQNYMMLDNLKLGYGGTKSEMERLLADAEEISGIHYDISNLADVYEAIHVIQTEMGITGTTAKEAATTISGSTNMMKAAWSNLLTGMADDEADFRELMGNFIDSLMTVMDNIVPRIQTTIRGIGQLITGATQRLLPLVINLINQELPGFLDLVLQLVRTLAFTMLGALPDLIDTIMEMGAQLLDTLSRMIPQIILRIVTIIPRLVTALTSHIPDIINAGIALLMGIVRALPEVIRRLSIALPDLIGTVLTALVNSIPLLLNGAVELFQAIVDAIPIIIEFLGGALPDIIDTILTALIDAFPLILEGAIELLMALIDAIPTIVNALKDNFPEIINRIVTSLIEAFPQVLDASITLLLAIVDAIPDIVSALIDALPDIITTITTTLIDNVPLILDAALQLLDGIIQAFPEIIVSLGESVTDLIDTIVTGFNDAWPQIKQAGKDLVEGLWNGMNDKTTWLANRIRSFCNTALDEIKEFFGIASPSKVMRDEIGKWLPPGITVGFEKAMPAAVKDMAASARTMASEIADEMSTPLEDISFGGNIQPLNGPMAGTSGAGETGGAGKAGSITFNQTINSPEPVDRLTVFRDTNSLLFSAGVRLNNV